jgi:hypothetical protein
MSQVVLLVHEGIACALPASQVVRASALGDEPPIRLFGGAPRTEKAERTVVVTTRAGNRRIDCSEARVGALEANGLHPMPELLRVCLGLPHVVGIAATRDGLRWLVDLEAWEER